MTSYVVPVLLVALAAWTHAVPSDYQHVTGVGYYKLHTALTKWNNAWKTCRDEGANLVVINTVREETEVMNIYAKYPNIHGAMWIGVHDQFVDNQFETVLGFPLSIAGRINWNAGEPNNANGGEHCVTFYRSNGKINDENCDANLPFMCEL